MSRKNLIKLFLRLALGLSFLSACADRFGIWPAARSAWGNMEKFTLYTGKLLPWLPTVVIPTFAWLATILELGLGILLLVGFKLRWVANLSGILLLSFAFSMFFFLSPKAPFDYSVFSAAMGAFALAILDRRD